MEQITTTHCPACNSSDNQLYLSVKDHFLSQEIFQLLKCVDCKLVFTTPRPAEEKIGDYYKSENYVSHSSTKKGIVNSVYSVVRNYTLNQKVRLVRTLTKGNNLLDIGAGTGHFLARAKTSGFSVLGLEPDETARTVAAKENKVELLELENLFTQQKESFDAVTMWHVLEHVYNLSADLDQIISVMKSNGVLIIAVPNDTSFDARYYQSFWAAYDVPRHLYHFSPESIIPLVEKKGLFFEKLLPMKFDSYYVSMLSEKYKGGNLINAFRIGWLSNIRSKNGKCSSQIYVFRKK